MDNSRGPALAEPHRDERLPRTGLADYSCSASVHFAAAGHAVSRRPPRPRQTVADDGDDRARHRIEGGRARYHQPLGGRARFRYAGEYPRGGDRGDAARRDALHRVRRLDRAEAGGVRQVQARERARLRDLADHDQLGRQAGAVQRAGRHDQPRGRGRHPGAVLGLLPGDGAAVRGDPGPGAVPAEQWLQDAARGPRRGDHAADQMADPQLAVEPERRRLHRGRSEGARRGAAAPPACLGHDRRHVRAPRL